jgi:hypothetical protein
MNEQRIEQNPDGDNSVISCQNTSQVPAHTPGIRGFIGYLISCCPYTMLAKKIIFFLRGESGASHDPLNNREIYLKSNIKIGYGIMLIGVFCPFFWFAFLSGVQGNDLMFNAVHSGIVILFGLLYFATYRIQLHNEQAKKKHEELPSQETL